MLIGGRYRVIRPLGSGGVGMVYLATDTQTAEHVAVKVLCGASEWDEEKAKRFDREFEALKQMRHTGVVRVLTKGFYRDEPFFAMEYLPGYSLSDLIVGPPPDTRQILGYVLLFRSVFETLKYIHGEGIIHRDLTPANIRIVPGGTVKLVDFGLAKVSMPGPELTLAGQVMGTAAYMSPEQASGEPIDARSDLYSAGICLYHAITGCLPFASFNPIILAGMHKLDMPSTPSFRNPCVPRDVEDLVISLMEKKPENRFPSAEAALSALDEVMASHRADNPPRSAELTRLRVGREAFSAPDDGPMPQQVVDEEVRDTSPARRRTGEAQGFRARLRAIFRGKRPPAG